MSPGRIWFFLISVFAVLVCMFFISKNFDNQGGITEKSHLSQSDFTKRNIGDTIFRSTLSGKTHKNYTLDEEKNAKIKNNFKQARPNNIYIDSSTIGIEMPPGIDSEGLNYFFSCLQNISSEPVRVLHFGDSQIEGDRISSVLRDEFQKTFGGMGPGIIPLKFQYGSISVSVKSSHNWVSHTFLYSADSIKKLFSWVLNGNVSYYMGGNVENSPGSMSESASLQFKTTNISYPGARYFNNFRLFYSRLSSDLPIILHTGQQLWFDTLRSVEKMGIYHKSFPEKIRDLKVTFYGGQSPFIYAASLDGSIGVLVDNLPIRGSSGLEFVKFDNYENGSLLKYLNPALVIIQFGVNVVPNISESYSFYERSLFRQLCYLKKKMPFCSFLVVGLSDMSKNSEGVMTSYPNIEIIKQAQRNAAFKAGCAFWDLYTAMGGHNSMVDWVNQKPALAQRDYTHFNQKGSEKVGKMLFNAIWADYQMFLKEKKVFRRMTSCVTK